MQARCIIHQPNTRCGPHILHSFHTRFFGSRMVMRCERKIISRWLQTNKRRNENISMWFSLAAASNVLQKTAVLPKAVRSIQFSNLELVNCSTAVPHRWGQGEATICHCPIRLIYRSCFCLFYSVYHINHPSECWFDFEQAPESPVIVPALCQRTSVGRLRDMESVLSFVR